MNRTAPDVAPDFTATPVERSPSPLRHPLASLALSVLSYLGIALLVLGCLRPGGLGSAYIGGGEIEGWLWRYWWLKQYLTTVWTSPELALGARIDLTLQSSFYPEFGNLLDLLVVSWPLEALFGGPTAYNAKLVLVLVANALAARAMARGLGASPAAAWLAGVFYAFNPYFLSEIANGRMRQAIGFTVPLYLLFLWRCWKDGGTANVVWSGVWWALTTAIYLYYGMFLAFFNVVFAGWALLARRRAGAAPGFLGRLAVVHVLTVLLVLPTVRPYLAAVAQHQALPEVSYFSDFPTVEFLASPAEIARPQNLLEGSLRRFARDSAPWDYPFQWSYSRAIPLACTLAALLPLLFTRRWPWPWVLTLLAFYLLSLGPYLKGGGAREAYLAYPGSGVGLPYVLLFKYVPFFSRLFSPIRLEIMVYAAAACLAALNLTPLMARVPRAARAALVLLLAAAYLLQMRASGAMPLQAVQLPPPTYYEVLLLGPRDGIIELPFRAGDYTEFYQSWHGRKVLGSWASAGLPREFPEGQVRYLAQQEPIQDLPFVRFLDSLNQPTPADPSREGLDLLSRLGYRFVVLHERGVLMFEPVRHAERFDRIRATLAGLLGQPVLETTEPVPAVGRPHPAGAPPISSLRVTVFPIPHPSADDQ